MKPIRVLHVLHGLGSGGVETFIMNMYRNIDRDKVQFDFLIRSTLNHIQEEEIKRLGGHIYITPEFPKRIYSNYKELKLFFKEHREYKVIHVHANALMYIQPLIVAKKYGIPCRIIHSHNTQTANNTIYKYIHNINKTRISKYANNFFACSKLAGKWMFNNDNYKLVNNAIDTETFRFNESKRTKIRKELDIENKFVVGHVGRLNKQKNHDFLLSIFKEIHKKNKDSVLVLVGEGELKEEIKQKVDELELSSHVKILGARSDVDKVLQAFDVFIFPSLFEGLPFGLIEAQTSGLKCFTSEKVVPEEANITGKVEYISLSKSPTYWSKRVLRHIDKYERDDVYQQICESGYDIKVQAYRMQEFYLKQGE